jgi:hypothetical protein
VLQWFTERKVMLFFSSQVARNRSAYAICNEIIYANPSRILRGDTIAGMQSLYYICQLNHFSNAIVGSKIASFKIYDRYEVQSWISGI